MLKIIAKLTIFKEKNVYLIGRSSTEWRTAWLYLDTSQKATATQQRHLVAFTEQGNFRLLLSIQMSKVTFIVWRYCYSVDNVMS